MDTMIKVFRAEQNLYFFIVFFTICASIYWILEKIGFLHWLRGWLWYFGLIDECPDTKRDR
jgi:hypothetical protein